MQIQVVGRHIEVPEVLKKYAEEKAGRLVKYYDRIQAIEVIFQEESPSQTVEVLVTCEPSRQSFVAKETSENFQASLDIVIGKLERQLTKYKEKLKNHKHHAKPIPDREELPEE
jgi:putative sigma-54 modulation protein